jgi:hypothetical protein
MKNEEPSKAQGDQSSEIQSDADRIGDMLSQGIADIDEAMRNAAGQDQAITELEEDTQQLHADVEAAGEEIDNAEKDAAAEAAKEPELEAGSETE